MKGGGPLDPLAASMFHALTLGLLPTLFTPGRVPPRDKDNNAIARPPIEVRPGPEEVEFVMFPQTWGSRSLGFGGLGGAAMTKAYTVVAIGPRGDACVYFDGHLAYQVAEVTKEFQEDIRKQWMPSVGDALQRYKIKGI